MSSVPFIQFCFSAPNMKAVQYTFPSGSEFYPLALIEQIFKCCNHALWYWPFAFWCTQSENNIHYLLIVQSFVLAKRKCIIFDWGGGGWWWRGEGRRWLVVMLHLSACIASDTNKESRSLFSLKHSLIPNLSKTTSTHTIWTSEVQYSLEVCLTYVSSPYLEVQLLSWRLITVLTEQSYIIMRFELRSWIRLKIY